MDYAAQPPFKNQEQSFWSTSQIDFDVDLLEKIY